MVEWPIKINIQSSFTNFDCLRTCKMFLFFILKYQNYQYSLIKPNYIGSRVLLIGLNILSSQKVLSVSIFITVFFISEPSSIWGEFKIRPMQCIEKRKCVWQEICNFSGFFQNVSSDMPSQRAKLTSMWHTLEQRQNCAKKIFFETENGWVVHLLTAPPVQLCEVSASSCETIITWLWHAVQNGQQQMYFFLCSKN